MILVTPRYHGGVYLCVLYNSGFMQITKIKLNLEE